MGHHKNSGYLMAEEEAEKNGGSGEDKVLQAAATTRARPTTPPSPLVAPFELQSAYCDSFDYFASKIIREGCEHISTK